jgi:hypothetical protein
LLFLEKPAVETAAAGILVAILGAAFTVFPWLWLKLSAWWIPATSLSRFLFGVLRYVVNSDAVQRPVGNVRLAWHVVTAVVVLPSRRCHHRSAC